MNKYQKEATKQAKACRKSTRKTSFRKARLLARRYIDFYSVLEKVKI